IGLAKVLPAIRRAAPEAELVVLFKPQFEVRRGEVGKGGIVRDPAAVEAALERFRAWCAEHGIRVLGQTWSALPGADGNRELLLHVRAEDEAIPPHPGPPPRPAPRDPHPTTPPHGVRTPPPRLHGDPGTAISRGPRGQGRELREERP